MLSKQSETILEFSQDFPKQHNITKLPISHHLTTGEEKQTIELNETNNT